MSTPDSWGKRMTSERKVISESPKRRPYASKVTLVLGKGNVYDFDGEVCLLTQGDFIVHLRPDEPREIRDGYELQRITATIQGFATACRAEQMGLRLSLALLWCAVSYKHNLKLEYHTPQPCVVFDRTQRSGGFSVSGRGILRTEVGKIAELIDQVLSKDVEVDPRLLVSMELFASSMMESTERARFVGLVSSLEPLASPRLYENDELNGMIEEFAARIHDISSLDQEEKDSIIGHTKWLRQQSISRSVAQLIEKHFPDNPKVVEVVKDAYNVRSKIVHEGLFDADLAVKGRQLRDIVRYIYSQIMGLDLLSPANIEWQ